MMEEEITWEVNGRRIRVTAEQLHGAERAGAWRQIAAATPRFAQYQDKTDRELPVIRLVPGPADRTSRPGPGAVSRPGG
jgi:F420H(2)-dependent quinone reductase